MDAVEQGPCIEERLTLPEIEQPYRHVLIAHAQKCPSRERNHWFARLQRRLFRASPSEDARKKPVTGQVI